MKKDIYIQQWLELKPYNNQTVTDNYYLKICNNIKRVLTTNKQSFILQRYLSGEDIDLLSCFLVSYLEDAISETNIWNSFVNIHYKLYNKKLPFYNTEEYYEEEINSQDISFLIWYFLNTIQEEKFISPYNDFITETATKVMDVLDEAFEYAPENKHLKSFYEIDENETEFYVARNLIDRILFKSYLFYPDTFLKLKEQERGIIERKEDDENLMMFINDDRDESLHKKHTRLLSLKGKEWASEILGKKHPVSSCLLNISQRIRAYFLYKGQDSFDIFMEHIASGKKFKLTKKSFDHHEDLKEINTVMFIGIALWKDEWWFSGVYFQAPFNADLILDEKNSMKSRMAVNFLDHKKQDTNALLNQRFVSFKDFNKGSQIAFLPAEKINTFTKDSIEFFNNSLTLSTKEIKEAKQRAKKDGFLRNEDNSNDFSEFTETGLVFFNPKSEVEIAFGVNSAFPVASNPFFNSEDSEESIMHLLVSEEISTELVMYCINNYKTKLPFFKKGIGKIYLEDMDFLLRFWKKENYHSVPLITYTGQEEN